MEFRRTIIIVLTLFIMIAIGILSFIGSVDVQAQDATDAVQIDGWSEGVLIETSGINNRYPKMIRDGKNLDIFWTCQEEQNDNDRNITMNIKHIKITETGEVVEGEKVITQIDTNEFLRIMEVFRDKDGNIELILASMGRDHAQGPFELSYLKLGPILNVIVPIKEIPGRPICIWDHFDVIQDSQGNLHYVYVEDYQTNQVMFYTKLDKDGQTTIRPKQVIYGLWYYGLEIAISNDEVFIFFVKEDHILRAANLDLGKAWQDTYEIYEANSPNNLVNVMVEEDEQGTKFLLNLINRSRSSGVWLTTVKWIWPDKVVEIRENIKVGTLNPIDWVMNDNYLGIDQDGNMHFIITISWENQVREDHQAPDEDNMDDRNERVRPRRRNKDPVYYFSIDAQGNVLKTMTRLTGEDGSFALETVSPFFSEDGSIGFVWNWYHLSPRPAEMEWKLGYRYTLKKEWISVLSASEKASSTLMADKNDPDRLTDVQFWIDGPITDITGMEYTFEFGDGEGSGWQLSPRATHRYSFLGQYEARARWRDQDGFMSDWVVQYVKVRNILPTALISVDSNVTSVNEMVSINITDVQDPDGWIWMMRLRVDEQEFELGPNETIEVQRSFIRLGNHSIDLLLTDNNGGRMVIDGPDLQVIDNDPSAVIPEIEPKKSVDEQIVGKASRSSDPDGIEGGEEETRSQWVFSPLIGAIMTFVVVSPYMVRKRDLRRRRARMEELPSRRMNGYEIERGMVFQMDEIPFPDNLFSDTDI